MVGPAGDDARVAVAYDSVAAIDALVKYRSKLHSNLCSSRNVSMVTRSTHEASLLCGAIAVRCSDETLRHSTEKLSGSPVVVKPWKKDDHQGMEC